MAKPVAILSPESNKAQPVAQGVLYTLAGLAVAGGIWAVGLQSGKGVQSGTLETAPLAPPPSEALTTQTPPVLAAPSAPAPPQPAPSGPAPVPVSPLRPMVPAGRELSQPLVLEAMAAGRQARLQGDMQGALQSFRSADLRVPSHPEILSEMALTYEAMGIMSKATPLWKTVVAMGESGAGGYYALAASKLGSGPEMGSAPPSDPVTLGNCQVIRAGDRVTVRVPLVALPGAIIDPTQMDIHVFLFEKVNGERIEQVRAEAPAPNWVSAPVDWKDGNEELMDLVYNLPAPKPEEVRDLGKRTFHGFLVRFFYQNKLVGEQAQPEDLVDFSSQPSSAPGVDNSLFPPSQPSSPAGVDNALFPK